LTYLYGCFSFFHPAMGDNFERVGRGDTRGALFCPFRGARIDPCSQLFPRFVSPFAACAGISFGAQGGTRTLSSAQFERHHADEDQERGGGTPVVARLLQDED
jgi:hypothetical protein